MENKNMEFNMEKAMAILEYIKAESEEDSVLLDVVELSESDHFSYMPNNKVVNIGMEPLSGSQDGYIIDYMNKEFSLNLKNTLLVRSINAFLHELGHHIDMGGCTVEELEDRMYDYCEYDYIIKARTYENTRRMVDILETMEDNINQLKEDELCFEDFYEEMDELVLKYKRIRKQRIQVDQDYRRNPAEYAADSFAAKIFKYYLSKTMPELFEEKEHVVRKLK